MARVISLLVAVVTAVAGHGLLFTGGWYLERVAAGLGGGIYPFFVVPFAVVGILLIGFSVLTAAWSALGVAVVGIVAIVIGVFTAFVPFTSPFRRQVEAPFVFLREPLFFLDYWGSIGMILAEGILFVVIGWSLSRRRRLGVTSPGLARLVAVLVTLVGLLPGTLLVVHGGVLTGRGLQNPFGPNVLGIVLLILGIIVLALLAAGMRWSGLGAIVWGALMFLGGLAAATIPVLLPVTQARYRASPLAPAIGVLPADLAASTLAAVAVGAIAVIGIVFLAGGIASAIAGRGVRHRETWVEPERTDPDAVEGRARPAEPGGASESRV